MHTFELEQEPLGVYSRLSNNTMNRVLDFMIDNRVDSYTTPEITRALRISHKSVFVNVKKLLRLGIVKVDRIAGNTHLYKYNMDNKAAKALQRAALEIASTEIDQEIEKQEM